VNSNDTWILQIDPSITKSLKKIPRKDAKRILVVIENLPTNPYYGDIQKMKGETNVWRRRMGSYRLFYEIFIEEKIVHVFHVERRTSQTY